MANTGDDAGLDEIQDMIQRETVLLLDEKLVSKNPVLAKIADLFSAVEFRTNRIVAKMIVCRPLFERLLSDDEFLEGSLLGVFEYYGGEVGLQGTFWNAGLYVSDCVPDGFVVLLPEGDPTVISADWTPSEGQISRL